MIFLYKFLKNGYGNMRKILDQVPLSLSLFTGKNIKLFAVRTQFARILNSFMYFWNIGSFLQTNLTVFDQAFHGAFLTVAILPYPIFKNVYSPESNTAI